MCVGLDVRRFLLAVNGVQRLGAWKEMHMSAITEFCNAPLNPKRPKP